MDQLICDVDHPFAFSCAKFKIFFKSTLDDQGRSGIRTHAVTQVDFVRRRTGGLELNRCVMHLCDGISTPHGRVRPKVPHWSAGLWHAHVIR